MIHLRYLVPIRYASDMDQIWIKYGSNMHGFLKSAAQAAQKCPVFKNMIRVSSDPFAELIF